VPFVDDALIARRNQRPLRYAGGIIPAGPRKAVLHRIVRSARPADPRLRSASQNRRTLIALHELAGSGGAGLAAYIARLKDADDRIDLPATSGTTRSQTPKGCSTPTRQPSATPPASATTASNPSSTTL